MANTTSAKKAIRSSGKKIEKNLKLKSNLKEAKKKVAAAVKESNPESAKAAMVDLQKAAGKASKAGGYLHKNTAARYVSRLAKSVSKLVSGK